MFDKVIPLGSTNGIPIRVHPTFALVLLWVVYEWGIRARGGVNGAAFGLIIVLVVFCCVLLHELAHAVAALRYGVHVEDITLLPIGGVARFEYTPLTPRAETVIALAGPATNIAIALALTPFILMISAIRAVSDPIDILLISSELSPAGFILQLWLANILLAIFNLLPAFPMDGGRVLRAFLASFRSRLQATRIAAIIGAALALLMAIGGLLIGDYVLILVAVFIIVSASMEFRMVATEMSLRGLPVGQYALWDGGGVQPNEALLTAISGGPRDVVVVEDGVVVGMLWRRDIMANQTSRHRLRVADLMDANVHAVEADDSLYDVHQWLMLADIPAVPVVENGRYRGVFTTDRLWHVYDHVQSRQFAWYRSGMRLLRRSLRLA
ncbi:MAG: site-2 protease family protein [Thermomicrobiales bacterium]|nr:site-2 protease family protein [Thermomicrobiales bacterium]